MAGLASINIKFAADLKSFSSGMQNANRKITKMGKNLTKVGKGLSVGVTTPFVAFGAMSLNLWDKQAKSIAQVEAGLLSTGNAVGFTSSELQKMASELQNNSLFGDEQILQDATAQLLTFTNIAGEQFSRTQQAAIDLSTRLGGDLKSASIQLGKALNDPIANLSALSRSGIQFSKEQKEVINSLVATNKLADAQTIILDELEKQYGNSAAAAAKAGLGPFKQLQNTIGDLQEDFGKIIGEALLPFVSKIKDMVAGFKALSPETKKTIVVIGSLAAAIGPLLVTLGFMMTTVIPGLTTAFTGLTAVIATNPFGALAVALAAVGSYFLFFNKSVDDTIQKQSLLTQINDTAAKSIANEKAKLAELLAIARHEGVSKSQRLKAIREINKISPQYLGNISLETINTDEARIAIEKYNQELLKTAKVKAAQQKLQEIQSSKIDIELSQAKKLVADAEKLKKLKEEAVTVEDRLKVKTLEKVGYGKQSNGIHMATLAQLQKEEDLLLDIITSNKTLNDVKKTDKPTGRGKAEVANLDVRGFNLGDPLKLEGTKIDNVLNNIKASFIDFSAQTSEIVTGAATNALAGFGVMIAGLASGNLTLGDVAGSLMQTIGGLATQLGKAAIEIGVGMLAIKAAFANPFTAIAAGVALVAIGALISSAGSVTSGGGNFAGAFAEGGVVGGSSFTGDKLFARINSGEMVLNKRQQSNLNNMISPSQQSANITLLPSIDFSGDKFRVMLDKVDKKFSRRK